MSMSKAKFSRVALFQMKECRTILHLEEYFESGLQSVILTEYLEVRTSKCEEVCGSFDEKGGELFERISSKEYRLTEDKCRMFAQQVSSHVSTLGDSSRFLSRNSVESSIL